VLFTSLGRALLTVNPHTIDSRGGRIPFSFWNISTVFSRTIDWCFKSKDIDFYLIYDLKTLCSLFIYWLCLLFTLHRFFSILIFHLRFIDQDLFFHIYNWWKNLESIKSFSFGIPQSVLTAICNGKDDLHNGDSWVWLG